MHGSAPGLTTANRDPTTLAVLGLVPDVLFVPVPGNSHAFLWIKLIVSRRLALTVEPKLVLGAAALRATLPPLRERLLGNRRLHVIARHVIPCHHLGHEVVAFPGHGGDSCRARLLVTGACLFPACRWGAVLDLTAPPPAPRMPSVRGNRTAQGGDVLVGRQAVHNVRWLISPP
jgi:hypothetical protein